MGCCMYSSKKGPSGFILPEQELLINELEQSHPFSAFEAYRLFEVFSVWGTSGEMDEKNFFLACERLSIPADTFYSIGSPCTLYMHELKVSARTIDIKKLLISGVLLSRSTWECKLRLLLLIYDLNGKHISLNDLCGMLDQLIHVSTIVLPAMSLMFISKQSLNSYIGQITSVKSALIHNLIAAIGYSDIVTEQKLLDCLKKKEQFQKILWSNGIRIMLIEEDTVPSHLEANTVTLPEEIISLIPKSGQYFQSEDVTKIQSIPSVDVSDAEFTQSYINKTNN